MIYRTNELAIPAPPKKKFCFFFVHKWVPKLKDPIVTGIRDSDCIFDIYFECSRCLKTRNIKPNSISDVTKAQKAFGKYYNVNKLGIATQIIVISNI